MMMAVTATSANDIGISARQARIINWSKRNRGRLQRTHMKTKITSKVFTKTASARMQQTQRLLVTAGLEESTQAPASNKWLTDHTTARSRPGTCQPPKNNATHTALVVTIPA